MTRRPPSREREPASGGACRARLPSVAVALLVVVVVLASVAAPAATAAPQRAASAAVGQPSPLAAGGMHGTHVDVDPQISSDGTVVVETLSMLRPGFVVLRADDDGSPGDPVGHARVRGFGYQADVPVAVDDGTWDDWTGNRTLWAVLHRDDGDGQFDPDSDPAMTVRNPAARAQFSLQKSASGAARVLGTGRQARPLSDGAVTLPRVVLPASGHLVVESIDGDETIGTRALDADSHANVSVALNDSFVADQPDRFRVRAVVYRDDGAVDGALDADDRPVTVAGESVATDVVVRKGEDGGVVILTPELTGTEPPDSGPARPTDGPAATDGPTVTDDSPTDGSDGTATASASGPGFGALAVLAALALLAVASIASRRTRRE